MEMMKEGKELEKEEKSREEKAALSKEGDEAEPVCKLQRSVQV